MWRVRTEDDPEAFAQLVARWQKPIQNLCARMTGDPHRGEDLAQETFARLFARRKNYEPTGKFSTQLRLSRAEVQDVQGPVGGGEAQSDNPITRIIVGVTNPDTGLRGTLQAGPGFSRTSNELRTQITQLRFQASLQQDDHDLLLGVDFNELDVFNHAWDHERARVLDIITGLGNSHRKGKDHQRAKGGKIKRSRARPRSIPNHLNTDHVERRSDDSSIVKLDRIPLSFYCPPPYIT